MPTPAREIRVAVAEPHALYRAALAHLLDAEKGIRVVAQVGCGHDAVAMVLDADPDVLVLDLDTPAAEGIEGVRRVREAHPRTEVVAVTAKHDAGSMRQAFEAGARGYLLKDCAVSHLIEAIRAASVGEFYLADRSARDLVAGYASAAAGGERPGGLITPRERQIACLLADGYSSKEAASALDISVKTVETHRASLMRKLGARNVTDIVKYCLRNQLIEI